MTDPRTPEQWTPRPPLAVAPGDFVRGTLLGDWSVEDKIGEGGMGVVYSAVHAEIGKRAAIKVIRSDACTDASSAERFVLEARLVNQVGHPNIVDIFHIGRLHDGRPYLVMELLRGRTLGERLAEGRVPATEAIGLLLQICGALAAAHAQGVVHRDLKPDNVFLVETRSGPVVKLVDWGIAKLNDTSMMGQTAMTRTGAVVGTPQYLSPEQARGKMVDERTDLYSLGVIAYELFLEGPPFTADNVADLIAMHLREPVPPPSEVWPDIPPALDHLLMEMLAKAPDERPTLPQIVAILEEVRAELSARHTARQHLITAPGGVPAAFASAASGGFVRVVGSEQMPAIPEEAVSLPAATTTQAPLPRRRRFALALGTLAVGAAAVAWVASRDGAAPRTAEEPLPPAAAPAPVAAAAAPVEPPIAVPVAAPSVLELVVEPPRARVRIDGEVVAVADGHAKQRVEPGTHEIEIDAPGHVAVKRTVEVQTGTLRVEIALVEERRPSRRRGAERRPSTETPAPVPAPAPADPDGTIDPFE
jgi:serine/threonine-protein kinase